MKSLQKIILAASLPLLLTQCQRNLVSKEKIERYVEFASKGENDFSSHDQENPGKITSLDYHGLVLTILSRKDANDFYFLRTSLNDTSSNLSVVVFLESNFIETEPNFERIFKKDFIIDGTPEIVQIGTHNDNWHGYFKDRDELSKRDLLRQYHQIISYVSDSLPLRK